MAKTPQTNLQQRPAKGTPERDRELQATAARVKAPTFTLVAWDRTAPGLIREWAIRAARAGAPANKVGSALCYAAEFDRWQADHGSKIPD